MTNAGSSGCPADEVVRDYVADRLDDGEAEAFEEHYFSCDDCHASVRRALELRSALAEEDAGRWAERRSPSTRLPRGWALLAAAVVLASIAGSAVWLSWGGRSGDGDATVLRGEVAKLSVEVAAGRDGFELRWSPVSTVDHYRVTLFSPEGEVHQQHETGATAIALEVYPRVGEPLETAMRFVVRVEGLDELRRIVVRSPLIPVSLEQSD